MITYVKIRMTHTTHTLYMHRMRASIYGKQQPSLNMIRAKDKPLL